MDKTTSIPEINTIIQSCCWKVKKSSTDWLQIVEMMNHFLTICQMKYETVLLQMILYLKNNLFFQRRAS